MWDRDSHGLFDYECKTLDHREHKVTGCTIIARNEENQLKSMMPALDLKLPGYSKMISVVYREGKYWIYHSGSLYKDDSRQLDESF